ncbi:MAG: transcriptional regulator [Armatimonadetes bacterium]|nr:transcriptional regulator [Armatimonadota bacterium]
MAERQYVVLSAIGDDRPGLVAALSQLVTQSGGNVEDSRMAVLGGSFGVMMLVSGNAEALETLATGVASAERRVRLRIHLHPTTPPQPGRADRRVTIEVEAADREGIVHAISEALYELNVNIVSLESAVYPAPVSGAPLFHLQLLAEVPLKVTEADLQAVLRRVEEAEELDGRIGPG